MHSWTSPICYEQLILEKIDIYGPREELQYLPFSTEWHSRCVERMQPEVLLASLAAINVQYNYENENAY
jgi:hypothetical protein